MDSLIVRGGHRLDGTLRASGSKNAALPIMAATLLAQGACHLERIPVLRDIATMLTLLSSLGATVSRAADGAVRIECDQACEVTAPYDLVKTMRASILVLGPLLARHGKAAVSFPGGCAIGSRPVDLHIQALEAMGAAISVEGGYILAEAPHGLVGTDFTFDITTVGGTENAVMAASLANGTTVLRNVAREPEIIDLVQFLRSMGADIAGEGTEMLTIRGVPCLTGGTYSVMPDRIEVGTYLVAAAATGGRVRMTDIDPSVLGVITDKLRSAGASVRRGRAMGGV